MENKFRNELEIDLAGEKILLRPTFENLAATENEIGSVAYLGWKYSRGVGELDADKRLELGAKSLPSLTESAKIIYLNQAEKKFSLEEIFEKVLNEGPKVGRLIVLYVARITTGNKELETPTEGEKKS